MCERCGAPGGGAGRRGAEWVRYVNGRGPGSEPTRCNNCLDCALSGLATWYGRPTVSAPRTAYRMADGRIERSGEAGGRDRAEALLRARFRLAGTGGDAFDVIAATLLAHGRGAAAVIVSEWPGVGAHAWNALNDGAGVRWVDFQNGRTGDAPLYGRTTGRVFAICLDAEGRAVDARRN